MAKLLDGWVKHVIDRIFRVLIIPTGNGGSVTINNVQGTGVAQWVALYFANGTLTACFKEC